MRASLHAAHSARGCVLSSFASFLTSLESFGRQKPALARACDVSVFHDASSPELWSLWSELERQGDCTVFQSAKFLRPLLQIVGATRNTEPHVCIVFDAIGPLLGLPFVRRRSGNIRLVEIADFGLSDYCAPVMAKRFDPKDATAWDRVRNMIAAKLPPADAVIIDKIPAKVAGRLNPLMRLPGVRPMLHETRQVPVDPVWLSSSVAKEALAKRRKLKRAADSRFTIVEQPEEIDPHLARMRALRSRRFESRGIRDSLDEAGAFDFYRTLLRDGCRDGGAVLGVLEFEGETIAMSAALVHRGRLNGVLTAMDETRAQFSPGLISMVGLFEWCLEHDVSVFDLGFGDQHYKARFGGERSMLHGWSKALSLRGSVWKLERDARAAGRRVIHGYPSLARLRARTGKSG